MLVAVQKIRHVSSANVSRYCIMRYFKQHRHDPHLLSIVAAAMTITCSFTAISPVCSHHRIRQDLLCHSYAMQLVDARASFSLLHGFRAVCPKRVLCFAPIWDYLSKRDCLAGSQPYIEQLPRGSFLRYIRDGMAPAWP